MTPETLSEQPLAETIAQLLEAAARFEDREWTQGAYARDAEGCHVPYSHPQARQFCASGRLMRIRHEAPAAAEQVSGLRLLQEILGEIPGEKDLMAWNDRPNRQPEEVRQLFRQAAARVRERSSAG